MNNNNNRKKLIRRAPLALALAAVLASPAAFAAGPQGGVFRLPGSLTSGNIDQSNPNATQVNLTTPGSASPGVAVIDWGTFNVDGGSSVNFDNATGANQAVINVDLQGAATQINGAINTSGAHNTSVLVVNPNGVSVGGGAQINTSGAFGVMAGSVDTSNPGQVSINLSQAPLVIDNAATIEAGTGAVSGEFQSGFAGVDLRSDGSPATLPAVWSGQETRLNIQVGSGDGNFQLNSGWRTEAGTPLTGNVRTSYSINGSQSNAITTNGASLDGVDVYAQGFGLFRVEAGTDNVSNSRIGGNGETRLTAGGLNDSYVYSGDNQMVDVRVSGEISNSTIGDPTTASTAAGASVQADRIVNTRISGGRGGADGAGGVNVQAREINTLFVQSLNGNSQVTGFDQASDVTIRAHQGAGGLREATVVGNAGATVTNLNLGVQEQNFNVQAHNIDGISTYGSGQVSLEGDGATLRNANFTGTAHNVFISGGENSQVSDSQAYVNNFGYVLGAGSTVDNLTLRTLGGISLEGGSLSNSEVIQDAPGAFTYLDIVSMENTQLQFSSELYFRATGDINNSRIVGAFGSPSDFYIEANAIRNSNISGTNLPLSDYPASALISGEIHIGTLENSIIGVTGNLVLEVDQIINNGAPTGTTVYRGNLVLRARTINGAIISVYGGSASITATEDITNSSLDFMGTGTHTVTADILRGGLLNSISQRRIDDNYQQAPGEIGTGSLTVNARRIETPEFTTNDTNMTVNASEGIFGGRTTAVADSGDTTQTNVYLNAPIINGHRVNSQSGQVRFGSVYVDATTITQSTFLGTDVEVRAASIANTQINGYRSASVEAPLVEGGSISGGDVFLDIGTLRGGTVRAFINSSGLGLGNIEGSALVIENSSLSASNNINLTVAQASNSVLNAVRNLDLTGGTIVIRDSQLLADVLRIQASGDLTVEGNSTLDAISRIALTAAGKLGIGDAGGNVMIVSERIAGTADTIVIGDNAALVVRTPSETTGSDRIQINGDATYRGDANQQATSGNFFGHSWTIIGDTVVLLDPPQNGTAAGEAGITLTARTVEVNGGILFAGPGQEDPDPPGCTVDCEPPEPPEEIVPPVVRVQIVRAGDVEDARYVNGVLLIPANLKARQGGAE